MQRIVILGAGGSGNTMLAHRLGQLLDLPVTHLDQLRYTPTWQTTPEPEFTAAQQRLAAESRWIIDGTSLASLPIRARRADTIILLDPHPLVCLAGILTRRLRYRGGQHADGVYDRITPAVIRYIWRFRRSHLPRVLACLDHHAAHAARVHLRGRRAADRYLHGLRPTLPGPE